MTRITPYDYLVLSAVLFTIGTAGVFVRAETPRPLIDRLNQFLTGVQLPAQLLDEEIGGEGAPDAATEDEDPLHHQLSGSFRRRCTCCFVAACRGRW